MKKSSTRLIAIGSLIVLGAFAIVLAQHDSRTSDRDVPQISTLASGPAVPIAMDENWDEENWDAGKPVIRGNNDLLPELPGNETQEGFSNGLDGDSLSPPPFGNDNPIADAEYRKASNPLREFESGEPVFESSGEDVVVGGVPSDYDSQVVLASGENGLPTFPIGSQPTAPPPAWVKDGVAGLQNAPQGPASNLQSNPTGLGSLPALPSSSTAPSSDTALAPLPTLDTPAGISGPPTWPSAPPMRADSGNTNQTQSPNSSSNLQTMPSGSGYPAAIGQPRMSDTQRGAMQPTSLLPPIPAQGQNSSEALPKVPSSFPGSIPSSNSNFADPRAQNPNSGSGATPGYPQSNQTLSTAQGPSAFVGGNPQTNTASSTPQPAIRTAAASRSVDGLGALVSSEPGNSYLDGSQNPVMLIHKRAPEEIQVGKKATFVITVRNAGNATAHDVMVVDSVPRGASFADSVPAINPTAEGILVWKLGEMAAGDERTISMQIIPEVQGEVGSVASVHFAAQASVRTIATLPKLDLALESQPEALIGDSQRITVTVRNSGTGVARGVSLEADIPLQLQHQSGESQLEAHIGDMRPSESKVIELVVSAVQPGFGAMVVRAVTEDGVQNEQKSSIEVKSPQLAATIQGPSLRYLERQANFLVAVQNTGTAVATDLDFTIYLPTGLKYIGTDIGAATYDPNTHTVSVSLPELPAGETAPINLSVLPVELGAQVIRLKTTGALGAEAEAKGQVMVDGLSELSFSIGQDNAIVETGASCTYSVQVMNVGNKADGNVQLEIVLPSGTNLLDVVAPTEYRIEGNRILFAPVAEMKTKDQKTYRIQVQHNQPGKHVVRSLLTSDNQPVAVTKETSVTVYNDRN